jgi:transcriptional regulator with XRE-family HTH domain
MVKLKLPMKVKALRGEKGWSQETLAKKAGIHRVTVAVVETGVKEPTLGTRRKLAKALGVPLTELLD